MEVPCFVDTHFYGNEESRTLSRGYEDFFGEMRHSILESLFATDVYDHWPVIYFPRIVTRSVLSPTRRL